MTKPQHEVSGRSRSLSKAWKDRVDYTHGLAGTSFHNTWRSIIFTIKGKRIGCDPRWELFRNFTEDMHSTYQDGMIISRKDKKQSFSKENCEWINKEDATQFRLVKITYKGETKPLKEWCLQYSINYVGARQRYYKGKNYTPHEIIFGKDLKCKRKLLDGTILNGQLLRDKASKMLAQYRLSDKKKNRQVHKISIEWFIENILRQFCVYCDSKKYIGGERIDNNDSHSVKNLVAACYRCNTVRGDKFTYEEMTKIGNFIRDHIDLNRKP